MSRYKKKLQCRSSNSTLIKCVPSFIRPARGRDRERIQKKETSGVSKLYRSVAVNQICSDYINLQFTKSRREGFKLLFFTLTQFCCIEQASTVKKGPYMYRNYRVEHVPRTEYSVQHGSKLNT